MRGFIKRMALCAVITALAGLMALPAGARGKEKEIILATTTSTLDSGLLDELIPIFQKKTGYFVKPIGVGSGQAMAMGERGEADVLLVHSPDAEKKFVDAGFGKNRRIVMHNDFVIVGPRKDPAGIKTSESAMEALKKLALKEAIYISRADNSGTHVKEMKLFKAAGIDAKGKKWFHETGLGMGQTLSMASEKSGYTLSDRGTYLAMKKTLALEILREGDRDLLNIYHVIEVNEAKWPGVNTAGAKAFADFMVSAETQALIKKYGVAKYGSPLFFPDAVK
ncbi:MAG TPA: substrate-binding domain-containing protein [Spirochaetota bacterium]|jgi:tungstate transport system substrate-binding protein|nr:MAG: PBP superfamily domain protein [Spirochaetes bacterium ADurb.BinA120]HPO45602.1 substrate-binding domain-containing protein [Spirochaetota bacterium]